MKEYVMFLKFCRSAPYTCVHSQDYCALFLLHMLACVCRLPTALPVMGKSQREKGESDARPRNNDMPNKSTCIGTINSSHNYEQTTPSKAARQSVWLLLVSTTSTKKGRNNLINKERSAYFNPRLLP